jgi:hypothetical protein
VAARPGVILALEDDRWMVARECLARLECRMFGRGLEYVD